MKRSKRFRKACVALILLTGVLLPFGGTSTMAADKRNTKASELVRPTLTVVTDTPKSNELALRWRTSKKADGYLLKYRRVDREKWNSVWIRNAKTHSYMMKDRKNVGYCIQLKAYSKKHGKYTYSKKDAVTIGKGIVNTISIRRVTDTYVLGYALNQKGKKDFSVSVSRSDLGRWEQSAAKGGRFVLTYETLKETNPAQIADVVSAKKLNS